MSRSFLPGTRIELVRPWDRRKPPKLAVFDFDGTLSLIRGGWTDLMVYMMYEDLAALRQPDETVEQLRQLIRDYVLSLNGAPTVYQMERFAKELRDRGATPEPASVYHQEYLRRLGQRITERKARLAAGDCKQADLTVPGTHALLEALVARGVELTLASGTEIEFVREESELLGFAHFFEGRIFAPGAEARAFAKEQVIADLLARHDTEGDVLLGFGDGIVETRGVAQQGGLAIAVACDETHRSGITDESKCPTLIEAGASIVVPDYQQAEALLDYLWQA